MNFDARSAFQLYDGSYIPNIVNLDSNWNLSWSKLASSNHLYFAIVSKVTPDTSNVYSDSEDEDDEEEGDEDEVNGQSSIVVSSSQHKDIYESLEDSDDDQEEEEEDEKEKEKDIYDFNPVFWITNNSSKN
ncbi:unnamed protein product [[Candida] boidinii]|nr:unnamed protein product [[Candida] boidinii]